MAADSARILVPVGESSTFRNTVAYALREAQAAAEGEETGAVHFVFPARWRAVDGNALDDSAAADLLERVTVWADEDLDVDDGDEPDIEIETAVVGIDRYLFSPGDFAAVLVEYAREFDLDRVVVDPEFRPGGNAPMLRPFEVELARTDLSVEEAPVERQTTRTRLVSAATLSKGILTFGATYVFYLAVAGSLSPFDLATGGVTALLAAVAFSNVSFVTSPSLRRTGRRLVRLALFVPYLVWEITKANISIAYIILHPDLPIDPEMRRFRGAVWGSLPVTTLGNSITLTPGTLTVDVGRDGLVIHTLTADARDDLAAGGLERAVRFVFYGRKGARIPTPKERESISLLGDDDVETPPEIREDDS
ncbi:monovalent cation/H+ antiporter subunit E [Halobellus captivus]|uniref:monovalent cation/H+ antiporter subunit E n=1 Tax=Halobellus captivus TaxID=2592614 RepID=UPI00119D62ED|nr:monovalent cation/H+ antiporter subunit E [Halobellus captivus]